MERVIRKLGLQQCRDVRIGSVFARGISGGQAKRVNIGIALVAEPRVLFLDEVTTGVTKQGRLFRMKMVCRMQGVTSL